MNASARHTPPLHQRIAALATEMLPFGPALADGDVIELAESFAVSTGDGGDAEAMSAFEAEYTAIRRHVGVMHLPQRGLLALTGADVKDYLHRLTTQSINPLPGGGTVRAFQLDDQGRVAADLIVHHGDEATWLELDRFELPWMKRLLEDRLFTEEVTVTDITDQREFLWLLGPAASRLLAAVAGDAANAVTQMPGTHHILHCAFQSQGASDTVSTERVAFTAYRWDLGAVLGIRLAVPTADAAAVYAALLDAAGHEWDAVLDADFAARRRASMRGRPVGWSAFNTVRIEEGVPMFHIDFGPDSLPAEVPGSHGIDAAVHFNKGCYLGQEVVARMKTLGHPKKILVGLKVNNAEESSPSADLGARLGPMPGGIADDTRIPVAGAQVFDAKDTQKIIGGVTSSAVSPLRGGGGLAMAVVRWGRHQQGTAVRVPAGGKLVDAEVCGLDRLRGE